MAPSNDPGSWADLKKSQLNMNTQMMIRVSTTLVASALMIFTQPVAAAGDAEVGRQLGFTCLRSEERRVG